MEPARQLERFITENSLFARDEPVLLAVSGGRDSVLMAHLFSQAGYTFGIAHCHFGLRAAADTDEQFTSQLAKQLNVPFYCVRFDTSTHMAEKKVSAQVAARDLRYEWLEKIRSENAYAFIATAHHRDDSAETVLINLVRGTGIAGLHGILPRRGRLLRPMLFLGRDDIDRIIRDEGIVYRDDESNFEDKYTRNKIRLHVMPLLREINPNVSESIEQTAMHLAGAGDFINEQIGQLRNRLFARSEEQVHILLKDLYELSDFVLFELFRPYGFNAGTLADLRSSWNGRPGARFFSETHELLLDRGKLILISRTRTDLAPGLIGGEGILQWNGQTFTARFAPPGEAFKPGPFTAAIDASRLVFPLSIRSWHHGDHIVPLGMTGRKKISDLFIDQKIPLTDKAFVPVVVNGNGEVIWVCGYRFSELYKTGPSTKKVFILEKL